MIQITNTTPVGGKKKKRQNKGHFVSSLRASEGLQSDLFSFRAISARTLLSLGCIEIWSLVFLPFSPLLVEDRRSLVAKISNQEITTLYQSMTNSYLLLILSLTKKAKSKKKIKSRGNYKDKQTKKKGNGRNSGFV